MCDNKFIQYSGRIKKNSNFILVELSEFLWNLSAEQKLVNCVNLYRKYGIGI